MVDFATQRYQMVAGSIAARGINDHAVLEAMKSVPRELFLPADLAEFAYEDTPLPIAESQTISQPYIVASMIEALKPEPHHKILEVGTGSGYAAAVLSHVVRKVFTIERHETLAQTAKKQLAQLGYSNIEIRSGDGTMGWPEEAPFDGIIVAAGGPEIPQTLLRQLKVGARLVMPVGPPRMQQLIRVTRVAPGKFEREELEYVQFVPLIGVEGWPPSRRTSRTPVRRGSGAVELLRSDAHQFGEIDSASLAPIIEQMSAARVVLLGEATHGTSEFYRMRSRITRELVTHHGFTIVAAEADWPDASRIDRYIRNRPAAASDAEWVAFSRFPSWLWRNEEVRECVEWLREHNAHTPDPSRRVAFYGLDLYSLYSSIDSVIRFLDDVDPVTAAVARHRYGCLTPWERDPAVYGHAALTGRYRSCENEVISMLGDLLSRQLEYLRHDDLLDAIQNARLVANAERYYRMMYYGSAESWNLRDQHMFDTLKTVLAHHGADGKAIIWAHNSHVGNAAATEMAARGELNLGQLCREDFGAGAFCVGFGTDRGEVAAASEWNGPMEVKQIRPSQPNSYERLSHDTGLERFLVLLRDPARRELLSELQRSRLERAIGVIYRPEAELLSHYFMASLPRQFDAWIWFDQTTAVTPLPTSRLPGTPDTYPFGV